MGKSRKGKGLIRDRVKELRRVRAGDLVPNPKNWRTHGAKQKAALTGILAEIGYADALLVRELVDGRLMLLDGHLRAEVTPNQMVPVLVLDLTEAEADKLLAVLDPLAAMAGTDTEALAALVAEIDTESEAVKELLAGIVPAPQPVAAVPAESDEDDEEPGEHEPPVEGPAPEKADARSYPIVAVVGRPVLEKWTRWKAQGQYPSDTAAFLALLETIP